MSSPFSTQDPSLCRSSCAKEKSSGIENEELAQIKMACAIQFSSKVVKKLSLIEDCSKAYRTTYGEIFRVDLLGWITFRAKILKKSVRQILSYFWFHILLVCKKSVLQIVILLWMNVKSDPISYSWNFEVGSYGYILRKTWLYLPVPSLSLGTRSLILAICWRLIVQISQRMVKDFDKQ